VLKIPENKHEQIAKAICADIRESERQKSELVERWIRLRAIHDCEENTSQVQLIEGMKPYMIPLSRTKADRILGAVVDGITGLNPYVQAYDQGNLNDNLDDVVADLMTLAEDAGDVQAIREGVEDAILTNCGVWRIRPLIDEPAYDSPQSDEIGGNATRLDWESIDPLDVCCYPPYYGTFAAAKTVGHRWSELLYRVKDQMEGKNPRYFKYDLKGGDDPGNRHRTPDEEIEGVYSPNEVADGFVDLWEVITELDIKGDGNRKKYLCIVAFSEEKLLSIQEYPYKIPWYIEVRTNRERKKNFPSSSVMQRCQGLQLAYSDSMTAGIQAFFASLGPIILLSGGGAMAKVSQAKPFMMVEVPAEVKIQTVTSTPNLQELPFVTEKIEETMDALTGIGRTGTGQQLPPSTTATEVDAITAAQNEAKDQYTQVVAGSVERAMNLLYEFYQIHYDDLKKQYGDKLVADGAFIKSRTPQLKVNGKNGSQNSSLVLQKLQMLLNLISNSQNNGASPKYDIGKIIDQMAQLLDLPFSLSRLEMDQAPAQPAQPNQPPPGDMAQIMAILTHPEVVQLLLQGEPLPQILQTLQNGPQSTPQDSSVPPSGPGIGPAVEGVPPNEPNPSGLPPIPNVAPSGEPPPM